MFTLLASLLIMQCLGLFSLSDIPERKFIEKTELIRFLMDSTFSDDTTRLYQRENLEG